MPFRPDEPVRPDAFRPERASLDAASADPRTDAELVRDAADGDAAAFDALYKRHREWVLALALRHTRRREDALDVAQDAFVQLLGKLAELEVAGSLTAWLYPVVVHRAIDLGRRRGREVDDATLAEEPAPAAEHGSGRAELERVLRALGAEQREVVLLRFADGFELQEIADALAIPLGTVKSRLHQALAHLRADPRLARLFAER